MEEFLALVLEMGVTIGWILTLPLKNGKAFTDIRPRANTETKIERKAISCELFMEDGGI